MDNALPKDLVTIGSWLAEVKAVFEALQKKHSYSEKAVTSRVH